LTIVKYGNKFQKEEIDLTPSGANDVIDVLDTSDNGKDYVDL